MGFNLHVLMTFCLFASSFGSLKHVIRRQIFYPDRPMVYTELPFASSGSRPPLFVSSGPEPLVLQGYPLLPLTAARPLPSDQDTNPWFASPGPFPGRANPTRDSQQHETVFIPKESATLNSVSFNDALFFHLSKLPIPPEALPPLGGTSEKKPSYSFTFESSYGDPNHLLPTSQSMEGVNGQNAYGSNHQFDRSSVRDSGLELFSYALPASNIGHSITGREGEDYPVYNEIPITSFSCSDQPLPGYYGDVEARCQVVHMCQEDGRHNTFLCPNGTIFNQQYYVCDWWFNFECSRSYSLYHLNAKLYKPNLNRQIY